MIIDLVIMQPIDLCNLNCSYCYLPGRRDPKLMSDEVLKASFKCLFNSSMVKPINPYEQLKIVWHSGEPLAAGIAFYEKALTYIKTYNKNNINVGIDIQSNATLLNKNWCEFIKQNHITLTISVDGPGFIHDQYRKDWKGKGSHKQVAKGIEILRKHDIPLRAICVLTHNSLNFPEEIYSYFKESGFTDLCFNIDEKECFNQSSSMDLTSADSSKLVIDKYRNFMSKVYDLWARDNKAIWIREFNKLHNMIQFRKEHGFSYYTPSTESLAFSIVSISKDGNISTFSPELAGGTKDDQSKFHIGNVLTINTLDELIENKNFQQQLLAIKKGVEKCSSECEHFAFCGGGSPSNKYYENGSFDSTETSYCKLTQKTLVDLVFEKLTNQQNLAM